MNLVKKIEIFTSSDFGKWQYFLELFPEEMRDIYYTSGIYSLYEQYGDGTPTCYFFTENGKVALYPFLLNSINNLGYDLDKTYYDIQGVYGYNGVLTNSINPDFIHSFYTSFEEYCHSTNIIAEFTRFNPLINNQQFSENYLKVAYDRETVKLNLELDYETIWNTQYSSKNRNMVRKAQKLGYTSEIIDDPSERQIENFIEIYHNSMSHANASKYFYFNKGYFSNIFKLLSGNSALVNIIDDTGKVVCSAIVLFAAKYCHYHLSGRSIMTDNSINSFLLDQLVQIAQLRNKKVLHFGGGRSSNPDDSLFKFKAGFSREREKFFVGTKVWNSEAYKAIISQWEHRCPDKSKQFGKLLLRYRF